LLYVQVTAVPSHGDPIRGRSIGHPGSFIVHCHESPASGTSGFASMHAQTWASSYVQESPPGVHADPCGTEP
jgi:hypothetical protein